MEMTQEQYDALIKAQTDAQKTQIETQAMIRAVDTKLDGVIPVVTQNQKALFGYNGTPGIISQVQQWAAVYTANSTDIQVLKNAVFGDPSDKDDSGMKGKLKDINDEMVKLKEARNKRDAIFWAAVSSSVTLLISTVIPEIVKAILNALWGG